MKIKINETRLKNIISEVMEEIVSGSLPKKDMSAFFYETFFDGTPYIIEEGLIKSYPDDRIIFALSGLFDLYKGDNFSEKNKILLDVDKKEPCQYYGIIEQQQSQNNTSRIVIKVNKADFNQNDFDKYFLKYGWFCVASNQAFGYDNIITFIYEKKFDVEVTDFVKKMKYIYHICPNIYLNKINRIGLKPKYSSWNRFFNPERIYFFINELSHEDFKQWVENFDKNKDITKTNDGWCLLKIDTTVLSNSPKFYFDPRMKGGIYTMDNISPDSIEIIDYINKNS